MKHQFTVVEGATRPLHTVYPTSYSSTFAPAPNGKKICRKTTPNCEANTREKTQANSWNTWRAGFVHTAMYLEHRGESMNRRPIRPALGSWAERLEFLLSTSWDLLFGSKANRDPLPLHLAAISNC